jgi:hypothetical protein
MAVWKNNIQKLLRHVKNKGQGRENFTKAENKSIKASKWVLRLNYIRLEASKIYLFQKYHFGKIINFWFFMA